jgi:hypothetical protein
MKFTLVAIVATLSAVIPRTVEAYTCINILDIVRSTPNDKGTAITFNMRDGKVWRNDLQGGCPDLRFYGFSWVLPGGQQVCDRQKIQVIQSGELCVLGNFTDVTPSPRKADQ